MASSPEFDILPEISDPPEHLEPREYTSNPRALGLYGLALLPYQNMQDLSEHVGRHEEVLLTLQKAVQDGRFSQYVLRTAHPDSPTDKANKLGLYYAVGMNDSQIVKIYGVARHLLEKKRRRTLNALRRTTPDE